MNGVCGTEYVSGESLLLDYEGELRGLPAWSFRYAAESRGVGRGLEDEGLRGYLMFVGSGADPDLSGAASVVGSELPLVLEDPGAGVYHVVVQRRNAYGVVSGNADVHVVVVTAEGEEGVAAPGLLDELSGAAVGVRIGLRAVYLESGDAAPPTRVRFESVTDVEWDETVVLSGLDETGVGVAEATADWSSEQVTAGVHIFRARAERLNEDESVDVGGWVELELVVPGDEVGAGRGLLVEMLLGRGFGETS